MVRQRAAVSPGVIRGAPGKRKLPADGGGFVENPSKRRFDYGALSRNRSPTPSGKNAHFASDPVMGPTPGDPNRRSQSPTRSALHKPQDINDAPSAQLRAEIDASAKQTRLVPDNKNQKSTIRLSPTGRGAPINKGTIGMTQTLGSMNIGGPNTTHGSRRARSPVRHEESDEDVEAPLARYNSTLGMKQSAPSISTPGHLTDHDVCRRMDELRSAAVAFAKSCPAVPAKRKDNVLDNLLVPEHEQLIRYIGCLAVGGQNGEIGWELLLTDTTCRQALVLGIIGRALKENVFSELYFGGNDRLTESLKKMEREQTHQDGFFRTQARAKEISKNKTKQGEDATFHKAVARITLQLEQLLVPFWERATGTKKAWAAAGNREKLAVMVSTAGHLSRSLRTRADVVYYWPPTFKDEEFEPGRMECFNLKTMISESPDDKNKVNGFERAVLRDGHEHEGEAIVRVVCFPGLVAYRQYGGAIAQQELEDEENERQKRDGRQSIPPDVQRHRRMIASQEKTLTGDEGFRTRVISKSVVLLQWGKQRLLTKEAGTSRHIDAMKGKGDEMKKYADEYDGFVELYDLYEEAVHMETQRPGFLSNIVGGLFSSRSPSASLESGARGPAGGKSVLERSESRGRR